MSATEVAQVALAISERAWLASLIILLFVLRRPVRTAAWIIRVAAWDWLLRLKGVPENARRRLIADAARRDLESR